MRNRLRLSRRIQAKKSQPAQIMSCHQGGGFVALVRVVEAGRLSVAIMPALRSKLPARVAESSLKFERLQFRQAVHRS